MSTDFYGLVLHLLLLFTSPHGDAITVSYRPESVCLKRTCTSPVKHAFRRTRAGLQARVPGLDEMGFNRLRKNGVSAVGLYQGMASAVPQSV